MRGTFKAGDHVRLKSIPSQEMTVSDNLTEDLPTERPLYECHWWWNGGKLHQGPFYEHELELMTPTTDKSVARRPH